MKLLKKGKVKDIYDLGNGNLLFEFTDRVSAFDVVIPTFVPHKGEVLCKFSEYWFNTLKTPNHMVEVRPPNKMVVRNVKIFPIECIVRGYLYGSLYERVTRGELPLETDELAAKLPKPYFDTTTKFEETDRPISTEEILSKGWLTESEYDWIRETCFEVYEEISRRADEVGFILADLKLEFGKISSGEIVLADSIGPDEFRLWVKESYNPGKTQESYDKQPLRDWLIKVGYKKELERVREAGDPIPQPPKIPEDLIQELSNRYIYAFERMTGNKL